MDETYTLVENLAALVATTPDSVISRTFYKDECLKAILFGFDAGQELSEHTSSQAAIIQIVEGEADVTVGEDRHDLRAGSWLHMPPRLKHSIHARTRLVMLLLMFANE